MTRHTAYGGRARRPWLAMALIALALTVASAVAACLLGPMDIAPREVVAILAKAVGLGAGSPSEAHTLVVVDIRLARVCLAWLVGAALAVAGAVFQGLLRNPLADPFTLGVSSGAAFGAALAIQAGAVGLLAGTSAAPLATWAHRAGGDLLPLAAMAGALAALGAVIAIGRSAGGLRRASLVLAGIVVATFLSACISLVKSLNEESVASIVFWIMGSFQGRGWGHVLLFLPWFVVGLALVWRWSRELDILALGETQARQLGVDAGRVRLWLLIGASLVTGAAVAVSGVIGFVGLVVPHLVRMAQGAAHRPLLVTSGLVGGTLMVWSDAAARALLPHGAELPVGVVTALVGGPFFCLLLRRRMKGDTL
ncbi:MAG: FecCD family ABC transporter permease [Desulfovibrionaceae bacterium]